MTDPLLLALDIGTSRTKAVLTDRSGTVRSRAAVPTPFADQGDGAVEMTAAALRDAVVDVLPAVLDRMDSTDPASPGGRWAAQLDSLADRTADAVRRITELTGTAPSMVVFGGGSASDRRLAAKAQRLDPIAARRGAVRDAAAYGAARSAGVAAGWWDLVRDLTR